MDALLGPGDGEACVELATGIQRRLRLVDRRERGDRGQVGRIGLCGEQLADRPVGDAHHPHLVVQHPRLVRDGLDHVVAVEILQGLEIVVRAARAAGAAHVHVDHREAHQVRERRDPALRAAGIGVAIARVLDQASGTERRPRAPTGCSPLGWRS